MFYQLITSHNFNKIPKEIFRFQRYFFNEMEHLQVQQEDNDCYTFYWQNLDNQMIEARFNVIICNEIAYSPRKATFGGIEFQEDISEKELGEFLRQIILHLHLLEVKSIEISSYPEGYLTKYQKNILQNIFSIVNFQVKFTEQNYQVSITDKSFYETVKGSTAKQLLRTYTKKGYVFKKELNPNFELIHAFINCSRERKSRPMTMSLERLIEHSKKFTKNFQLFTVHYFTELVAVGVTIRINDHILYTFLLADEENHLKDSPTTFLLSGIYEYGQQNNYKILDFGIATEKGMINEGLSKFKQSLGAKMSEKRTYHLSL